MSEHGMSIAALSLSRRYRYGTYGRSIIRHSRRHFLPAARLDITHWPLTHPCCWGNTIERGERANAEHAFLKSLFSHAHLMPSSHTEHSKVSLSGKRLVGRKRSRALATFCNVPSAQNGPAISIWRMHSLRYQGAVSPVRVGVFRHKLSG